jgi:integrase
MLRTKSGLPKHCSWNFDRHGKRRVRFRLRGFSTYLTGTPWSENFMRQHAAALDGVKARANEIGAGRTVPGSFDALVVSYYRSPDFHRLKPNTQVTRRSIIERFRSVHGHKPLNRLERKNINDIIGARSATPEAANTLLKTLRILLAYAVDQDMINSNPAVGVKKYKSSSDGFHCWSEEEILQFESHHAVGTQARLALALGLYTAQRGGDAHVMGWQHVSSDAIAVRQEKTDAVLMIPLHPKLKLALASVPRTNMTFLVTEIGAPFTKGGFGNWFRIQCDAAGLKHCSFHGLRKAAATRLANAGCSTDQIRAFTGHSSARAVEPYIRARDQKRLARQALNMQLGAEQNVSDTLSNLPSRLDKTGAKS